MSEKKKRSTSTEWGSQPGNSKNGAGPSKRVRFGGDNPNAPTLQEIDDSDLLEQRKGRRGAVTVVKYDSGDDSSEDEDSPKKKKVSIEEILAEDEVEGEEPQDEADDMFATPEELAQKEAEKRTRAAMKGKTKATIVASAKAKQQKGKKKLGQGEFDKDDIEGEDMRLEDLDENEYDSDGNPKIEAFNMKDELEDGGEIDASGNFIRKLDPDRFHDNWLEGLSRKEIQAAREAHDRKLRQQQDEEREAAKSAMTETDIYIELVNILKPRESVLEAIQRLGGGGQKKKLSAASKAANKKKSSSSTTTATLASSSSSSSNIPAEDPEVQAQRKQAIEKLTDLCDKMMAMGHFDIYEETYEQAVRSLRRADIIEEDWIIGTPVLRPEERAAAAAAAMLLDEEEDTPAQWEYKWASPPEGSQNPDEVFGPFSGAEMKSWSDQGFFSQGILVRMAGDTTFQPATPTTFT
ncbi:hypothetical protein BGZ83_012031 [Gryganskiella cystojenkinii]|nr:hypothetical protein BGZ83_012031 [Gryganskiella cystojenkinii]